MSWHITAPAAADLPVRDLFVYRYGLLRVGVGVGGLAVALGIAVATGHAEGYRVATLIAALLGHAIWHRRLDWPVEPALAVDITVVGVSGLLIGLPIAIGLGTAFVLLTITVLSRGVARYGLLAYVLAWLIVDLAVALGGNGPTFSSAYSHLLMTASLWFYVSSIAATLFMLVREFDRREAERNATADRLRFNEERYRTLVQEAFDAFVVADAEGRIQYASGSYERVTGYTPEERFGADGTDLIHPDQVEDARKARRRALANPGKTYRAERLVRRKDGEWRTCEVALTNLLENPAVAGLVTNFRDVTDRVEAEAARRDSEERFEGAFHKAPIGMALMSLDGRFLQANAALEDLLGYSEHELVNMTREDITTPDECFADDVINDLIAGRRSSAQIQRRLMRSDDELRHCTVSLSAVRDAEGDPAYLIMQFADVTPLTRARQDLEQALSSKDELVASVSHELRTPLTSVIGFGELLREQGSGMSAAERRELTKAMTDQARDLAGIVEDLLVVARTDADVMRLTRVSVDLRAQAAQVLEAWDWSDTAHIELAKGSTRAMGDPARVRQILRNLITNAMRYGGDSIRLECDTEGTLARIRVVDDGPGVPRDAEDRVFDRYQRASKEPGVTASMGLGLTVSRRLARLMDGDLEYRREGGETVFELALPRAASGRSRDTEAA